MRVDKTIVLRPLKDGSGRACIHWMVIDDQGPVELENVPGNFPYRISAKRGRICCNPSQNKVTPLDKGNDIFVCLRSMNIMDVTCPDCLATAEAKSELEKASKLESVPLDPTAADTLKSSVEEANKLAKAIAV